MNFFTGSSRPIRTKIFSLHARPWISPWIKSISKELVIAFHVIASQLSGHCDVFGNRLWRHQQNRNWVSETREWSVKVVVVSWFMDSFCPIRNKKCMYSRGGLLLRSPECYFWCLFPSLLRISGNKHQNNPLVSAETVRHSSTYIILYIFITASESKSFLDMQHSTCWCGKVL